MARLQEAHYIFFFSSRRRHTICSRDWSSDVCSSDLNFAGAGVADLLNRNLVIPQPTITKTMATTHAASAPYTVGKWFDTMKKIRGKDMYVLCLLRREAIAGIEGSAAGPVPFTPAMIFRWFGQIRIQTLAAMMVPNRLPA